MHKHTIDLLKRLLAATEEERLKWQEVPGKTAFSYLAGDFVVLVDADEDQASFRLTDSNGRVLEQADKEALGAADIGSSILALDAIERICAIARRQALGTDEAITAVMQHLETLGKGNDEAETAPVTPPVEATSDEPPFLEELAAPKAEEEHPAEPELASDQLESKEQNTDDAQHSEPIMLDRQTVQSPPAKKQKKRKRSLLNFFGRKKS